MQVSASRSDLLLQCARPWGPDVLLDNDVGEAARYGSAYHVVIAWAVVRPKMPKLKEMAKPIAEAAKLYGVEYLIDELEAHLAASLPMVFEWLSKLPRKSGEKIEMLVECSMALNMKTGEVRVIPNPTVEDHRYELLEGEIAGTADLIVRIGNRIWVVDHKTGIGDFSRPDQVPQILTLGLMFARRFQKTLKLKKLPDVRACVFHAFRRGIAKMYEDDIEAAILLAHEKRMRDQFFRIGDGSMKNGPACDDCPARMGCPAGDSDLLMKAEALMKRANVFGGQLLLQGNDPGNGKLSRAQKLGLLYEVITQSEELARRGRASMKDEMKRDGIYPELTDGRVLVIKTRNVERLSKREFVQTYGKLGAERMFDRWRKDHALVGKDEEYMGPASD